MCVRPTQTRTQLWAPERWRGLQCCRCGRAWRPPAGAARELRMACLCVRVCGCAQQPCQAWVLPMAVRPTWQSHGWHPAGWAPPLCVGRATSDSQVWDMPVCGAVTAMTPSGSNAHLQLCGPPSGRRAGIIIGRTLIQRKTPAWPPGELASCCCGAWGRWRTRCCTHRRA